VRGDCLKRSPSGWLSVCSAALALAAAGCGGDSTGSERLDPVVAERLAAQSDAVADAIEANDGCAAADRLAELRAALDAEAVPEAIRQEVERVAEREFVCVSVPPPAPPPTTPPPPPPPPVTDDDDHGHDDDDKKGKRKKDKRHGDEDDD
jgi:hypothetical protein